MTKTIYTLLIITGHFFYSCGSAEQVQQGTDDSQPAEEEVRENGVPSWYNSTQRTYQDSTEFAGTGIAIASDSLDAVEKSVEQAQNYLEFAIDSYAEDVRRDLSDEVSNSDVNSEKFILSLRQAVRNLQFPENELTIKADHSTTDGGTHRVYTRVSFDRTRAIDLLASAVGNDQFSRSLREGSGL